jgi:hypothetical protein
MAPDQQREVDDLYRKAQKILLHEMTEDEQSLVAQLAIENHATLSEDKLSRLRELVRKKGGKQSAA